MNLHYHRIDLAKARRAAVCLAAAWSLAAAATAQVAPLSARSVAVDLSSGRIDNPGNAAVVFSVDVDLAPEALWVRVQFAEADLPGDSAVRVTSLLDGEAQTLSSQQLSEWRSGTAFFNGSAVRIELLAGAGTTGNLLRVGRFVVGQPPLKDFLLDKAICGTTDQRTPSSDPAVGRLPGSGCTGFLIDCPDGGTCLLSAGHCFAGELSTVIQFDVPGSETDCTPRHPPMDKQFAIDPDSLVIVDGGPGNDWALFRTFANPETGRTVFAEQGASYAVAEATPAAGEVRVTGFGVDAHGDATGGGITACGVCNPVAGDGNRNQTQQTHSGDILEHAGSSLTYGADTCAGNSGSPVISAAADEVVAVHTHTGCAASGNFGTAITRQRLLEALANRGELALDKDGTLNLGTDGVANPGDAVDYTFRITNTGQVTVTGVTVIDPLVSPISCPGDHPIPFLEAGATVTCTGSAFLTQIDVDARVKHNTAVVTAGDPVGTLVRAEDSHSEPVPPPTGPPPPPPPPPTGPQPFSCTGEAYIIQNENAQLTLVDQTVDPFEFVPIGAPAGIEINNLGFRSTDGYLYGVALSPGGNGGIVRIDSDGNVFNLGYPPAFPSAPRFDAGDVTPDGTVMYITATSRPLYRLDLTQLPSFPPVTHVAIHPAGGSVSDWAVSPVDGMLYGGDSAQGQLAVVEPSTGVRVDYDVPGLPAGSPFGGAWFDAAGRLFLYRNSGAIYEIDVAGSEPSGPTIVDVQSGPGSSRNDGAACSANVVNGPAIDLAKNGELDLGGDGVANPGDLVHYTFRVANVGVETLTAVTVDDPLVASISCPGGHPIPSMAPGASQTCTGSAALTQADVDAGVKDNTATVTALAAGGQTVGDQDSHSQPIANPGGGPVPFACTGEAYIVQNQNAQLTLVDQTVTPFDFIPIGDPTGIEINNLGFRAADGLLYAVELSAGGNVQILQIDSRGDVFGLGRPPGLPAGPRFDAGDVSPDGSTMYVTANGQALYRLDLTSLPALPAVTSVGITGSAGFVFDWAVNPDDGRLYGGDSTQGQLAVLDPATGVRTDFAVAGLPAGAAYGGAWFDASGRLFLYQNSGAIYEIDVGALQIVDMQTGPSSTRNDGAACIDLSNAGGQGGYELR